MTSLPEPLEESDTPMTSDTTVHALWPPETIDDPLTTVLREGARRLLAEATEAEAEALPPR